MLSMMFGGVGLVMVFWLDVKNESKVKFALLCCGGGWAVLSTSLLLLLSLRQRRRPHALQVPPQLTTYIEPKDDGTRAPACASRRSGICTLTSGFPRAASCLSSRRTVHANITAPFASNVPACAPAAHVLAIVPGFNTIDGQSVRKVKSKARRWRCATRKLIPKDAIPFWN